MLEETKRLVKRIDGWLTDNEGELLYNLAKSCKGDGVIVEIGSWKGKSTIWLAKGSKAGNKLKVYAVDPHTGSSEHREMYGKVWTFEEFRRNIKDARVDDIVIPVLKTSEQATKFFDEPVEFIFIDGAHEYQLVKLDFELWFPRLIDGGIIAFHDTTWSAGPKEVAKEYVYKSEHFRNAGLVGSITFAEKVKQNCLRDRIRNRYILLLMNICEFAGRSYLPERIRIIGRRLTRLIQ